MRIINSSEIQAKASVRDTIGGLRRPRFFYREHLHLALIPVLAIVSVVLPCGCSNAADGYEIPTVVKVYPEEWFDRMEVGVKAFGKDSGHKTYMLGPPRADASLQVQILENLVAEGVDAITVVPYSPETLEPVLKKAMDQGIIVVSHEASNQENSDYDIEAFDNSAYGSHLMDKLAECMEQQGDYAVFVGNLSSQTHNEWVDAAVIRQREAYPQMRLVGPKNETFDNSDAAYGKAHKLLKEFPELKGMLGSSAKDVAGIGRAIEERASENDTCVVGTSLPSIAGPYLETGSVDMISFWDPADAGYIMNLVAVKLLQGETLQAGEDLGLDGYDNIKIEGSVIYGEAWIDVNASNLDQYPF